MCVCVTLNHDLVPSRSLSQPSLNHLDQDMDEVCVVCDGGDGWGMLATTVSDKVV